MLTRLPIGLLAVLVVAMFAHPANIQAHGGAEGIIKERMEVISSVGREMKHIGKMTRGKAPMDSKKIASAAGKISRHAERMGRLFPVGTNQGVSRSSPKIWQDWNGFMTRADIMVAAARELENIAKNGDTEEIKASFRVLSKSCGGCHKLFRTEKPSSKISY